MTLVEYEQLKEKRKRAEKIFRPVCHDCFRPLAACFCRFIQPFISRPRFAILIHTEELRRRVATGRLASLCVSNSYFIKGVDFTEHPEVNALIEDPTKYPVLLFPSEKSVDISLLNLEERESFFPLDREPVIFILDATWAQARAMWRMSQNLQKLPQISFTPETKSRFYVRKQPAPHCYSTLESIHRVLELMGKPPADAHNNLLEVFDRMVNFQLRSQQLHKRFWAKAKTMDRSDPGTGNVLHPKTTITSMVKTLPVTFNEAVLHQKYVLEKRSLRQIAAEFASSKTAIRGALVRFGIPLRETGKSPNRTHNLPFGKQCAAGKVVDHKGEQRVIQSVLKMHGEGLSNCAIARVLTQMKVPTKQQGRGWHHEMVRQILLRNKRLG